MPPQATETTEKERLYGLLARLQDLNEGEAVETHARFVVADMPFGSHRNEPYTFEEARKLIEPKIIFDGPFSIRKLREGYAIRSNKKEGDKKGFAYNFIAEIDDDENWGWELVEKDSNPNILSARGFGIKPFLRCSILDLTHYAEARLYDTQESSE